MTRRILSLTLLTLVIAPAFVLLVTRYSKSEASFPAEEKRMKVLRRKGQLKLKPTAREMASFKKNIQGEKKEEREVEEKIPKNVPIKVKLRAEKEKAFKDLKNGNWLRDLELEVTNTSDKPIYFLELWLMLPDTKTENNTQLAFSLRYGRGEFIHFETLAVNGDVPIQPTATFTFTIPYEKLQAWQDFKRRRNEPDPKKVEIKFIQLSFGDGKGFRNALPYPYEQEQASTSSCREGPKQPTNNAFTKEARIRLSDLQEHSLLPTPAAFLPVNFSVVGTTNREPKAPPPPDLNCPGTNCIFAKDDTYQCVCSSEGRTYQIVSPPNAYARCQLTVRSDFLCGEFGVYCTQWDLVPCSSSTPTPSPSPSPSPSPTPADCP